MTAQNYRFFFFSPLSISLRVLQIFIAEKRNQETKIARKSGLLFRLPWTSRGICGMQVIVSGAAAVQQQKNTGCTGWRAVYIFKTCCNSLKECSRQRGRNASESVGAMFMKWKWHACVDDDDNLPPFFRVDQLPLLKIQSDYVTLTNNIPKTIWIK